MAEAPLLECVFVGCADDFNTVELACLPALQALGGIGFDNGGDPSGTAAPTAQPRPRPRLHATDPSALATSAFAGTAFFACNVTQCNYGCRSGGNCRSDDLEGPLAVAGDGDGNEFMPDEDNALCPPEPVRFTYTAMVNSTARHEAPTVTNKIHTALLRAKLLQQLPDTIQRLLADGIAARARVLHQDLDLQDQDQGGATQPRGLQDEASTESDDGCLASSSSRSRFC